MLEWLRNIFNRKYQRGTIRLLPVSDVKLNEFYITRYGISQVIAINAGIQKRIQIRVQKRDRYVVPTSLFQFQIYDARNIKMLPFSSDEYYYLTNNGQEVEFRCTKRGHAQLSPRSRKKYYGYKVIQKTRNGHQILNNLIKAGYKINK